MADILNNFRELNLKSGVLDDPRRGILDRLIKRPTSPKKWPGVFSFQPQLWGGKVEALNAFTVHKTLTKSVIMP